MDARRREGRHVSELHEQPIAPIGDHSRDSTAALFDYHRGYLQTLASLYRGAPIAEEILVCRAPGPMLADTSDFPWTSLAPGLRLKPTGRPFSRA